ncbi:MAG: hypothetical protein AMXMBFR4_17840 [Candidatus Hydrogenedentota bacterium]
MRVILVVAEEAGVREALAAALNEAYIVFVEASVEQALRRMITAPADAIVLEDTPKLGAAALARLRHAAPHLPVIVLAARNDSETRASFILAGARACLGKPFACGELVEAIEHAAAAPPDTQRIPSPSATAVEVGSGQSVSRHQTALLWLNRASAHFDDPEQLSQLLADALVDVFRPTRCAVLMEQGGRIRVAAAQGLPLALIDALRLDYSTGLMRWFEECPSIVDRAAVPDAAAAKELQLLGARLGAPLMCGGSVAGALLVGEKVSGLDYTPEERELLSIMARSAGVVRENAYRYREISERQGRLSSVLTQMSSGIVVVAADKSVTMLNERAAEILRIHPDDVIGRSVQKLGSSFADVVLRTMAQQEPLLRQEIRDASTGEALGISASPLSGGGAVVTFARLARTERPETSAEDIVHSPYWEYLSARVAQEVKNPLVAINTFAQLLPRKYESAEFRNQFAEVVQKEVARINRVVEVLFEFARPPRMIIQRAPVNEVVSNVLSAFDERFRGAGIAVFTDLDSTNPEADMDALYFSQAIHNVLQNALEAMPDGGKLKVTTRRNRDGCNVTVADTGPGIAPEVAPLIFLPFFGARETGMGLGLAVANRIMRQHHGTLRLVSSESGATFEFYIPLRGAVSAGGDAHAAQPGNHAAAGAVYEDRPRH